MRTRTTIPFIAMLLILCGCERKGPQIEFAPRVAGALVDRDGHSLQAERQLDVDYILIYFSAHWCPPCQAFTPRLVQFYNTQGGGRLFQVVFLSSDRSEDQMYSYMRQMHMPWPAVRYRSPNARDISNSYANSGIPQLVLINPTGKILADSYKGQKYLGPQHVLAELSALLAKRKADPAPDKSTIQTTNPNKQLEKFNVTGLFQAADKSVALINDTLYHEGDSLAPGIVVEKITGSYVEVSCNGHRYRLAP